MGVELGETLLMLLRWMLGLVGVFVPLVLLAGISDRVWEWWDDRALRRYPEPITLSAEPNELNSLPTSDSPAVFRHGRRRSDPPVTGKLWQPVQVGDHATEGNR
ncbi:hypothetical protein [Microlunatus ginsengisoli]|uniref:Uncharacterized protein n=1 Tax=Microlunatus ginsengisoli TaxID=363863 RepID=A0ABP7ALG1_9ACTN